MKYLATRSLFCVLALTLLKASPANAAPESEKKADKAGNTAKKEADCKKDDVPKKEDVAKKEAVANAIKAAKSLQLAKKTTHEVKKGPFKIEVKLKGIFEARKTTEVVLRPKTWASFSVLKAVKHGTRVKEGDLLVTLDMEKIDEAIADLRTELRLSDLVMKQAEEELRALETLTPMDLARAERSRRIVKEDLDLYLKTDLPMAKKSADFMLKMTKNRLEYQQEELRQLEKMYKADDLTEETEEIILKRARNTVEQAKFYYELAKQRHQRETGVQLPREEEITKDSARRRTFSAEQAKLFLPLLLKKQRLEQEKRKVQRTRSGENLKKLLADRAAMTVKAPAAGIVYYGQCVKGKWSSGSSQGKFRRGASLAANQVFMTIVKPRPVRILAQVPEKELHNVKPGLKGTARPTGYPDVKLIAIVASVAPIPSSETSYDAEVTVELSKQSEPLMPGMTCTLKLPVYIKKNALRVPVKAVADDPLDDEKHYVYLVDKKGKSKKHPVEVGKRTDKLVEILSGLSEGDKILAECPKQDTKKQPQQKKPQKK